MYCSDVNFAATWLEDIHEKAELIDCGDFLLTRAYIENKKVFYPPILKTTQCPENKNQFVTAFLKMKEISERDNVPLEIRGLDESVIGLIPPGYKITFDDGESDYIYLSSDLINLQGNKFHSKRNHIYRFYKQFPNHTFREYLETDYEQVMQLCNHWSLPFETQMIERALANFKELELKIMVLFAENKLVGFSVNSMENSTIAHTLFEKADRTVEGAYQALNNLTARALFQNIKYVNRQSDMNIQGLRKSKQSYHPIQIVKKYKVTL